MLFGSSGTDIINLDKQTVFAKGGAEGDIYVVSNDMVERTQIIDNKSEDRKLDILSVQSIDDVSLEQEEDNLSFFIKKEANDMAKVDNIVIKNYFLGNEYQHLILVDKNGNSFIPFELNHDVALVHFYQASSSKNVFILPTVKQTVIGSALENIEFYRNNNDFLLLEKDISDNPNPLVVILKDFYSSASKWKDHRIYAYNNGDSHHIDLLQEAYKALDYKEYGYEEIVKEYIIDFTKSVKINHNQELVNDTLIPVESDQENIGVAILKDISPEQIEVYRSNNDLVLKHNNSNHTVSIKNWCTSEKHRVSMLEFDLGLNPIRIRRLDKDNCSTSYSYPENKLANKIIYATQLYTLNKKIESLINPDTEHVLRCVISINSINITEAPMALGFTSPQDQINFMQTCDLEKDKLTELKHSIKDTDLLSNYSSKLCFRLLLYGYEYDQIRRYRILISEQLIVQEQIISGIDKIISDIDEIINIQNNNGTNHHNNNLTHHHRHHHGEVGHHRHRRAANSGDEYVSSSATTLSSPINDIVSWLKETTGSVLIKAIKPVSGWFPANNIDTVKDIVVIIENDDNNEETSVENDNTEDKVKINEDVRLARNKEVKSVNTNIPSGLTSNISRVYGRIAAQHQQYGPTILNVGDHLVNQTDKGSVLQLLDMCIRKRTGQKLPRWREEDISDFAIIQAIENFPSKIDKIAKNTKPIPQMYNTDTNASRMPEDLDNTIQNIKYLFTKFIQDKSMNVNKDGDDIISAIKDNNSTKVRDYLEAGKDVNASSRGGMTLLMRAVSSNSTDLVKLLIEHGADVNATDSSGEAAINIASDSGNLELIRILISNGAIIKNKTEKNSPFSSVAESSQPQDIKDAVLKLLSRNRHSNNTIIPTNNISNLVEQMSAMNSSNGSAFSTAGSVSTVPQYLSQNSSGHNEVTKVFI